MLKRKILFTCLSTVIGFILTMGQAAATNSINLSSPQWLGNYNLDQAQLKEIKKAMEKALDAPIDAEQQCGKVRLDCVVRAAREWKVGSDKYREIVINIHTVGHTSHAVGKIGGKWPAISINK
jgi:hypothetical protein